MNISDPVLDPPYDRLLVAAASTMEQVNYQAATGIAGVKIRHARNRAAVLADRPCITLIMVGDEPGESEQQLNMGEVPRMLFLLLQADLELPTELSATDPTGVRLLGRLLAAAERALRLDRQQGGTFNQVWADYVPAGAIDPDENADSKNGRLVRAISVLYRVRSDDSNVLLKTGENA